MKILGIEIKENATVDEIKRELKKYGIHNEQLIEWEIMQFVNNQLRREKEKDFLKNKSAQELIDLS